MVRFKTNYGAVPVIYASACDLGAPVVTFPIVIFVVGLIIKLLPSFKNFWS